MGERTENTKFFGRLGKLAHLVSLFSGVNIGAQALETVLHAFLFSFLSQHPVSLRNSRSSIMTYMYFA